MRIIPIASVDVRLISGHWAFAERNAHAISQYWRRRTVECPALFNGDVVLLKNWALHDRQFSGECISTDYKSFLYWREHEHPDNDVSDFFAAAALHSAEGWLILGRSARGMSNAGKIYPPCGSLHHSDLEETIFDVNRSIIRELREETGLEILQDQLGAMLLIEAAPQIVILRPVTLRHSADEIVRHISQHLTQAESQELAEAVVIKGRSDIQTDRMPRFIAAYIQHVFSK